MQSPSQPPLSPTHLLGGGPGEPDLLHCFGAPAMEDAGLWVGEWMIVC